MYASTFARSAGDNEAIDVAHLSEHSHSALFAGPTQPLLFTVTRQRAVHSPISFAWGIALMIACKSAPHESKARKFAFLQASLQRCGNGHTSWLFREVAAEGVAAATGGAALAFAAAGAGLAPGVASVGGSPRLQAADNDAPRTKTPIAFPKSVTRHLP
jgi:hypothetical protein